MSSVINSDGSEDCITITDDDVNDISSDSDDCAIIPDREECDRLCKEFAEISNTNSALAMYYLQDRDWSLEVRLQRDILIRY